VTATRHLRRAWDRDGQASLRSAKVAFLEECERLPLLEFARRQAAIEALPTVQWKGRTLYTIRCHGDFGKGPHDVNVPEAILWQLISVNRFLCPYHR
jgi:hypothetical protein